MKGLEYHRDAGTLHLNCRKIRSYYLPAKDEGEALQALNGRSSRKIALNGQWKFAYYKDEDELTAYGSRHPADIPDGEMGKIPVPSCWQIYGYGTNAYVNLRYPFPCDPPFLPDEDACGLYRRTFAIKGNGFRSFLNFEGVDSCLYVWINGSFVGYSQVSHSTSEFEVTSFVHAGENRIDVLVFRWCVGSYLEDQDKLRMSGIFRDVYILQRPLRFIEDFFVHTELSEDLKSATLSVDIHCDGPDMPVRYRLVDENDLEVANGETKIQSGPQQRAIVFSIGDPVLWSAEEPRQYTLFLDTEHESIAQMVGFRKITIQEGAVLLNGRPLKFFGVNRHDSDPRTGYAIDREQALKDLLEMKAMNINAIRTSHYPNAPWFPQLCSRLGFYLVAEADVECHGASMKYGKEDDSGFLQFTEGPLFREAILDRIQRNVIRDKNNAAIVVWSLGNESGYGRNFSDAGHWAKTYDPSRLVHYQGAWHADPSRENDFTPLDVFSRMYAPTEWVDGYFSTGRWEKPFMQCEFTHAMGNGPGDIEENISQILTYPGYVGGFVWEWCDHSVYGGRTQDGRAVYRYGGDWKEGLNDGNFCMDGLVFPDRKPHTGLLEYKNCIRPVRASLVAAGQDGCTLRFANNYVFLDARSVMDITYEIRQDGAPVGSGSIDIPHIAPNAFQEAFVPCSLPKEGIVTMVITYTLNRPKPWAEKGYVLGFDEITIASERTERALFFIGSLAPPDIRENSRYAAISSTDFSYTLDKRTGLFRSLSYRNVPFLVHPMDWNTWRAPIDNDRNVRPMWEQIGYDRPLVSTRAIAVEKNSDIIRIDEDLVIAAQSVAPFLSVHARFLINGKGQIECAIHARRDPHFPALPRFGIRFFLPPDFNDCTYRGYGPYESYCDKHRSSTYGWYDERVENFYVPYLKPQEHGSRWNVDDLRFAGKTAPLLLRIGTNKPFSFNASVYDEEELTRKAHDYELEKNGSIVLCLDAKMGGTGSASCGPELKKNYQVAEETLDLSWILSPEVLP
ncbi:MAG: glycoside hydrolase family 2 TIM barrel-domain containing protein [Candidatus Methanomethylophilaceae archaeon]